CANSCSRTPRRTRTASRLPNARSPISRRGGPLSSIPAPAAAVQGGDRRAIAVARYADAVGGLQGGVLRGDHSDRSIAGDGGPCAEPAPRTHFTGSGRAGTADVRRSALCARKIFARTRRQEHS